MGKIVSLDNLLISLTTDPSVLRSKSYQYRDCVEMSPFFKRGKIGGPDGYTNHTILRVWYKEEDTLLRVFVDRMVYPSRFEYAEIPLSTPIDYICQTLQMGNKSKGVIENGGCSFLCANALFLISYNLCPNFIKEIPYLIVPPDLALFFGFFLTSFFLLSQADPSGYRKQADIAFRDVVYYLTNSSEAWPAALADRAHVRGFSP